MIKKKVRAISVFFVAIMVLFSAAACGNTSGNSNSGTSTIQTSAVSEQSASTQNTEKKSWEKDTTPVTLKIFMDLPGLSLPDYWGKDETSKKWIKETGINLEWICATDTQHSKLNVLLAGGDIPDLVYAQPTIPQIQQMAKEGGIWALNELAKTAAPNFMNNFDKHMIVNLRMLFKSNDIYMIPFNYIHTDKLDSPYVVKSMEVPTVSEKIYKEIGSPQIKSADDYLNMLRAVKKKYSDMTPCQINRNPGPDEDGNPNIIGKALGIAGLSEKYFKIGDGYVKYWQHPNFIKLLKFANTLYNEQLISSTELTDKKEQLWQNIASGKLFSELNQDADNIDTFNNNLHANTSETNWIAIDPFTIDPSSMKYSSDAINAGTGLTGEARGLAVSKTSKHADRAIQFCDFLMQDHTQMEQVFGIEGIGHTMVDGMPVLTKEAQDAINKDFDAERATIGCDAYWTFRDDFWERVRSMSTASDLQKAAFNISGKYYEDLSFYHGADNFVQDSEEQKITIKIKDYYSTQILKVIMAKPQDVEPMYNSMIAKMKEFGLDKLNAYWTKYFAEKQQTIEGYSKDLQ
jgi:hypothetical protein